MGNEFKYFADNASESLKKHVLNGVITFKDALSMLKENKKVLKKLYKVDISITLLSDSPIEGEYMCFDDLAKRLEGQSQISFRCGTATENDAIVGRGAVKLAEYFADLPFFGMDEEGFIIEPEK